MAARHPEHRVAFIGTHNWRAHEAVRWWAHANYSSGDQATGEAAVPRRRTDVFGVARPELPADAAKHLSQLQWLGLKPGSDERVASVAGVEAVVCSGQGPHEVQAVKDCAAASKGVFVESLERFSASDLEGMAASATASGAPLMSGLYSRFDAALQEVAELGLESMVGRPLLYTAHASTLAPGTAPADETLPGGAPYPSHMRSYPVTPSLYELGIQQVDALRWLLDTEPVQVYAVGTGGCGADLNSYTTLALTIKTSSGAVASITLDAAGSVARQRVTIVGASNRAAISGAVANADLQAAAISHFLDVVTAGTQPRITPTDCLRAVATMAAAAESLCTGAAVAVVQGAAAAPGATAAVSLAAGAGAKVSAAAASLVEGARALIKSGQQASKSHGGTKGGATTPPQEAEEGGVSTPPHQGTPPPKAVTTPESPPLLPSAHRD